MKRASSSADMRRNFKKTKYTATSIRVLAKELQTEIFARVAADSCADISRCKLSCKLFKEIAEDGYVYRHVSLDKIPIITSFPNENREAFLERCKHYENPEIIYRQAVIDYFSKGSMESACQYLKRAVDLGHEGAFYLTCIVLIYSGDDKSKENGIKLLGGFKKSNYGRIKVIRKKLMNHLRWMWVEKSFKPRPICCTAMEENHRRGVDWDWNEYADSLECEACIAEFEIKCISGEICSSYLL